MSAIEILSVQMQVGAWSICGNAGCDSILIFPAGNWDVVWVLPNYDRKQFFVKGGPGAGAGSALPRYVVAGGAGDKFRKITGALAATSIFCQHLELFLKVVYS